MSLNFVHFFKVSADAQRIDSLLALDPCIDMLMKNSQIKKIGKQ